LTTKGIKGLGNDIIEIDRVRQGIERHGQHFLDRLFTQKEQAYCFQFKDSVPHFAARFAGKEAVAKALGCGFGKELSWHDLEILTDEKGKPHVHFSEKARTHFSDPTVLISLSHSTSHATAVAILYQT
jgi:holo-[acyl-carrier protein] synthase